MYESPADLTWLQSLLDESVARASEHLTSIIEPHRRMTAERVVEAMTGMQTLALATVTATGEPRLSGVDGHFLRGRWHFTTSGTAVKARHLIARPSCSVAHLRGDDLGVFVHGHAVGTHDPEDWVEEHLVNHYGSSPRSWGPDIVYYRLDPTWMVGYENRA